MKDQLLPIEEGGIVVNVDLYNQAGTIKKEKAVWDPCPNCGEELNVNGRCKFCSSCGWETCFL